MNSLKSRINHSCGALKINVASITLALFRKFSTDSSKLDPAGMYEFV